MSSAASPSSPQETVRIGIIGGGLMGREMASAFARWCALEGVGAKPELAAVADVNADVLAWFERIPTAALLTADYRELLESDLDVVYVAVPHHLHRQIYLDVLDAGKDLLAEKPFGIDLAAAREIRDRAAALGRFVRCSSEFPFFPGAQRAVDYCRSGKLGRILEAASGFHHSSDLDPDKASNWKRQSKACGEIGVLGDLGMHAAHLPLRLGWRPARLFAQLQKGYAERRGVPCDTWDNAALHAWIEPAGAEPFPLRMEMKRLAPGQTNSWFFEALGTDGGVRFSTHDPKALWTFQRSGGTQAWSREDLGFGVPFKAVTGGIFEVGFPDVIQQMWAAFLEERAGRLAGRFGCATPDEAVASQEIWDAALRSQAEGAVAKLQSGD